MAEYNYKDIEAICLVSDYPGGFVVFHGGYGRMVSATTQLILMSLQHLFALERRDELLKAISTVSERFLGLSLRYVLLRKSIAGIILILG